MADQILVISPKTKVGELLEAYPQLEEVLIGLSPAFEKLKNPVLRKTVARVATLQQVAIVGGLKVDELVNRLRKETGQEEPFFADGNNNYLTDSPPGWFDPATVIHRFDAIPVINEGGSPMADILAITQKMKEGEALELKTPFVPAPIIDVVRSKGFKVFSIQGQGEVLTWFTKE
jgi:hypothetical protein